MFRIYLVIFIAIIFISMAMQNQKKWEAASTVIIPDDGGLHTAIAYIPPGTQSSAYDEFITVLDSIETPPIIDEGRG